MEGSFKELQSFMDMAVPKLGIPGIDCIVYQNHNMIFRYAAGYSDIENKIPIALDALYNIYSATKMITCVAAIQLIERGKLTLFDPLYEYLPEFKSMMVKTGTFVICPAQKPIRIIDLFLMTAGISYELDTPEMRKLFVEKGKDFGTRDFVGALAGEPLMFEPGEGWNYSYCHDVLGAVIEEISGMSFGEYLKANIFDPLGMRDTGFTLSEEKRNRIAPQYEYNSESRSVTRISSDSLGNAGLRHESGGGGLISSTEDYILFVDALACGGIGAAGKRIISENSIRLMSRNHLKGGRLSDFRKMIPKKGVGYGLGFSVIIDSVASGSLVPENSFSWGGLGGVMNLVDTENKLSYFVAQHTIKSPKERLEPNIQNIIYSTISKPFN